MNVVMTAIGQGKDTYIQFRVREDLKEDIRRTAEARGLSVSGLIHSLLVRAIREEKELSPDAFQRERSEHEEIIKKAGGVAVAPRSQSGGIPLMNPEELIKGRANAGKKKNKRSA